MRILGSFVGIIVACMCQWLFLGGVALAADECEVVKSFFYERVQGEIVTDWGLSPYKRYQTVVYPCADVTVRDTYGSAFIRVVEITATLSDQSRVSKKAWCDKKSFENDVMYSCIVCFESDFPVSSVTCNFR